MHIMEVSYTEDSQELKAHCDEACISLHLLIC